MMKRVLVTGGGGFVGTALVRQLLDCGCKVSVAGRNRYPHLEQLEVCCLVGDIAERDFGEGICQGVDTVFHTAAKAGIWGDWKSYKRTNIDGTLNILNGCRKNGVERLIYTSTPSVVFERHDIEGADETLPYGRNHLCHYARSKTIAEREVLSSSDQTLATCAIRPHLIWGPNDPHLIPRLLERGRAKALKIVGSGANLVDITYVDNVAHAHVLAAKSLINSSISAGQAYFIGQERPVRLWDWINELFQDMNIAPVRRKICFPVAFWAGAVLELFHKLTGNDHEPKMTRFLALQLARSHYFSHQKATRELDYRPIVSLDEGKKRLLAWLNR